MLQILICEDESLQRARIEEIVARHIISTNMTLSLSTARPSTLLNHIQTHQISGGLYFLDVDLQSDINGIELAAKVRKMDANAIIVFITSQAKLAYLVFRYKVEAMDYITKSSPVEEIEARVAECMALAHAEHLQGPRKQEKLFSIKIGNQVLNVPLHEILFFESSVEQKNQILLHRLNGVLEFRGYVNKVSNLGAPFFHCHQSFVINVEHIQRLDTVNREVEMANGMLVPISRRKLSELMKTIEQSVDIINSSSI